MAVGVVEETNMCDYSQGVIGQALLCFNISVSLRWNVVSDDSYSQKNNLIRDQT